MWRRSTSLDQSLLSGLHPPSGVPDHTDESLWLWVMTSDHTVHYSISPSFDFTKVIVDLRYFHIRFSHTLVQEGAFHIPGNTSSSNIRYSITHCHRRPAVDLSVHQHPTTPLEGFSSIYTAQHGTAHVNLLGGIVSGPLPGQHTTFDTVNAGFHHDATQCAP